MSGKTIIGIALIILGALVLAYRGFTYTTQKKEHHEVDFPPLLGALALFGGVAVLVVDRRAR